MSVFFKKNPASFFKIKKNLYLQKLSLIHAEYQHFYILVLIVPSLLPMLNYSHLDQSHKTK